MKGLCGRGFVLLCVLCSFVVPIVTMMQAVCHGTGGPAGLLGRKRNRSVIL